MLACCINIDDEHDTPASSSCCSTLLNIDSSGPAKNYGVCNLLKGWDYTIYLIVLGFHPSGILLQDARRMEPQLLNWFLQPYQSSNYLIVSPVLMQRYVVCNLLKGWDYTIYLIVGVPSFWHFAAYPVSELVNNLPSTNAELCSLQYAEGVGLHYIFNSVNPPLLWHFASYPVSELVNSLPSTNAVQSYGVCNMLKGWMTLFF